MILPETLLHKVYDLLEERLGAEPWNRDDFIDYFAHQNGVEYRCCPVLGFGGKFWNYDGKLYVSCYPEDETDDRYVLIEEINGLLKHILEDYLLNP